MKLELAELDSSLGTILIAVRDGLLCALDYGDYRSRMETLLARRFGDLEFEPASNPAGVAEAVRAYLRGDLAALSDVRVDTGGTAFQRRVWSALRRIPCGQTRTYAELARSIARPRAARAVGAANGRNPVAIVLPCHRVVGSNGSLVGYAGGLERKRALLKLEGAA
jgi:methylated-DNA-[protein]-cysteine S-methyltransferase